MINQLKTVRFSTFPNYLDTCNVIRIKESLADFEQRFAQPVIGTKSTTHVFAMAAFGDVTNARGSLRHADNISDYYGIVLDIDNDGAHYLSYNDALNRLKNFYFIAYTTSSSTKQKNKFRIVIPLSKPIAKEFVAPLVEHFRSIMKAGDALDGASKTISQIFIFPVCADQIGVKSYRYHINDQVTALFDPTNLLATLPATASKTVNTGTKRTDTLKATVIDMRIANNVKLSKLNIASKYKKLIRSGAERGRRSNVACAVITHLVKRKLDAATIAAIVLNPNYGISERFFEKGNDYIQWTFAEIDRIKKLSQKVIKGIPPHYPNKDHSLTPTQARTKLGRVVNQLLKSSDEHQGIIAPAGVGKSFAILNAIIKSEFETKRSWTEPAKLYEIYVPNHALAEEMKTDLQDAYQAQLKGNKSTGLKVTIMCGRAQINSQGVNYCKKIDLVNTLTPYGYNIHNSLCNNCEFKNQCLYLKQYEPYRRTQVRIYTHAHLPLSRHFDKRLPDLAVIDESFFAGMIDNRTVTLSDIKQHLSNFKLTTLICNTLQADQPLLAALRHEYDSDQLHTVFTQAAKQVLPKLPKVTSETQVDEAKQLLSASILTLKNIHLLLTQLYAELCQFPDRDHSITVRKEKDYIVVANRHKITRFTEAKSFETSAVAQATKQVPVLCIDADFKPEVASVFLTNIQHLEICVERNAHVTQIWSSPHPKRDFIGGGTKKATRVKQMNQMITMLCAKHQKPLIVTYRDLKPLLKLPSHAQFAYFGAIRGLNKFKDCDAVIVIGRHQIPIQAAESMAAALWWDSPEPLNLTGKFVKQKRGYRLLDHELGVKVDVCTDWRSQLIMELHRECETLQALDRIRLINDGEPKHVYLLSNLPVDIRVDHLTSKTALLKTLIKTTPPIRRLLAQIPDGVLSLNPSLLHTKYKIGSSESAAKRAPGEEGMGKAVLDHLLASNRPILVDNEYKHIVEYRTQGQCGKYPSRALAPLTMPKSTVLSKLQSLHNCKVEFIDSTHKRLQHLKPVPNELDYLIDEYYAHRQYDPEIGEWCITLPKSVSLGRL